MKHRYYHPDLAALARHLGLGLATAFAIGWWQDWAYGATTAAASVIGGVMAAADWRRCLRPEEVTVAEPPLVYPVEKE